VATAAPPSKKYKVQPPLPERKSKDPLTAIEIRKAFDEVKRDAAFQIAAYYELDRSSKNAIAWYRTYRRIETDRRQQDRALWAIARIYESTGNLYDLDKTYRDWRKLYGNDSVNTTDVIRTHHTLAKLYGKRGGGKNQRNAAGFRQATIDAWTRVPAAGWTKLAKTPAGKINVKEAARMAGDFELLKVENHYHKVWLKAGFKRPAKTSKAAGKEIAALEKKALTAIEMYENLALKYSPGKTFLPDYALVAWVRIGEIYLTYNERIFNIPIPTAITKIDNRFPDRGVLARFEDALRAELEKKGYRKTANRSFQQVVDTATRNSINNKWVTYAKDQLNKEFGGSYQILSEGLIDGTEEP
jgi:hypothetical protein